MENNLTEKEVGIISEALCRQISHYTNRMIKKNSSTKRVVAYKEAQEREVKRNELKIELTAKIDDIQKLLIKINEV